MRLVDGIGAALVLGGLVAALLVFQREEEVSGSVRVVDGDSLRIGGRNIRLSGIDAPELHQSCLRDTMEWPCGEAAKQELLRATAGSPVLCNVSGRDRYARSLARCNVGGRDLGALLVERGMAVAYGAYEAQERSARDRGVGVWAGTFERPSDWRKRHPRPAVAQTAP